jgi:hypothetical protein
MGLMTEVILQQYAQDDAQMYMYRVCICAKLYGVQCSDDVQIGRYRVFVE